MHTELRMPDLLVRQLIRLRERLAGVAMAGGIGLTLLVISLQVGTILLLDWLVELPVVVRVLLLISVPVSIVVLVAGTVLLPFLKRYRQSDLAVIVESAHPELKERLLSLVELQESAARGEEPSSEFMRSLLMKQTVEFAEKHDFVNAIDATRAVRRCWLGGAAFCALLLPLLFASNAYAVLLSRFLNPWGNYERPQNLILTIDQPDRVIGRGDDVTLVVHPGWRFREGTLPDAVWIEWSGTAGPAQTRRLDWEKDRNAYAVLLPQVNDSMEYHVFSDQSRTRRHQIRVVDRPEIRQFTAELIPPAYTGEAALHFETVLGELLAIEQSRLELQLTFNKPVVSAEIVWLDGLLPKPAAHQPPQAEDGQGAPAVPSTPLPLSPDRQSARLNLTVALNGPSGRFLVQAKDEHGLTSRTGHVHRLTIRPDLPPVLGFADQEQHASARPQDAIRIPLQVSDDFGVMTVELHYDVLRDGRKEPGMIAVPVEQLAVRELSPVLDLDLARLNLKSGMQVALRARATDERPVPGPNETWTGTRLIQILDDARPYGEQTLAEAQHRIDQAMGHLKADLEQQRQQARQLQARAQTEAAHQQEWSGDKQAAALEENIQELAQQMQKLSAVLEEQPLMQPLAEQAREISERELAQAAEQVEQSRQAPLPQKQKKLSEAAEHLQKAEEQLKKLQEEHQAMAQMQRDLLELNRLAQNTERLANQVDELTQRKPVEMPNQPAQSTPQQELWNQDHQRLLERHEQLESDLAQVLRDHPELIEKARENLQHRLATLGERSEQLARQQEALSRQAKDSAARKPSPSPTSEATPKAASASPESSPPPAAPMDPPSEPSSLATLPDAQQEVVDQSRQLGEEIRRLELPQPQINRASSELSNVTRAAAHALSEGDFERAAKLSQEATEKASQFTESLKKAENQPVPERLQTTAEEASQKQQALNQQIQKLAGSSEQQEEFRRQRQDQLQRQTQELAKDLSSQADQLELKEIDRPEQARSARQARDQLQQAARQMQQPMKNQPDSDQPQSGQPQSGQPQSGQPQSGQPQSGQPQSGQPQSGQPQSGQPQSGQPQSDQPQSDQPQSGQPQSGQPQSGQPQSGQPQSGQPQSGQPQSAGQNAAESLRAAGKLAKEAAQNVNPRKNPENPAQGEAGQHVAESAQHLHQAGQQLAQLGQPQRQSSAEGQDSPNDSQQDGNGQPENGNPNSSGQSSGEQGQESPHPQQSGEQSDSSGPSQSLRDAARNMREAAQQLGLASRSQKSDDPNQQPGGRNTGESTGKISSETASNGEANLVELGKSLGKVTGRNWGQLPRNLQTELMESSQRPRDAVYGGLIRRYFEEISRSRPAQLEEPPAQ